MVRTRSNRLQTGRRTVERPIVIEDSTDDEIENTNSSIEVPRVSVGDEHIEAEEPTRVQRSSKRQKTASDSINISSLGEKIGSSRQISRNELTRPGPKRYPRPTLEVDPRSWVDKYAPSEVSGIAMHPKKLKEIESALSGMITATNGPKILLLTGPAGSGKSTSIQLLATKIFHDLSLDRRSETDGWLQQHDLGVEWGLDGGTDAADSGPETGPETELDTELDSGQADTSNSHCIVEYVNSISSNVDQFPNFLHECKLLTGPNLKVVLVEDLPNVFHLETKLKFQKALQEYLSIPYKLPPLCICLSENEFNDDFGNSERSYNIQNNFVAETVIGPTLLNHPKLQRIKLNPIAKTFLKKLLSNIISQERPLFDKIPKHKVESKVLNLCVNGDIRSVINCLEFWARFYSQDGTNSNDNDDFLSFGKENNLNIFNAIGKIVYGTAHEDNEILNYKKLHNIEDQALNSSEIDQITIFNVVNNFSNKSVFFNLNLLENYAMLNSGNYNIDQDLCSMLDNLSCADILNRFELFEIASNVSVRSSRQSMRQINAKINGAGVSNSSKYKNQKLVFSKFFKSMKLRNSTLSDVKDYQLWKFQKLALSLQSSGSSKQFGVVPMSLSSLDAVMLDGFYEPMISNSIKNEARLRKKILMMNHTSYVPSSMIPKFPRVGGSFNSNGFSTSLDSQIALDDDYNSFHLNFASFKTAEEKLMDVITGSFDADAKASDTESEFDEDPIEDEDEAVRKVSEMERKIIEDFELDQSFEDDDW